jgi:hypothetical protein
VPHQTPARHLIGSVRREKDARDAAGRDVLGYGVALLDIVGYPAAQPGWLFVPAPFRTADGWSEGVRAFALQAHSTTYLPVER